MPLVERYGDWSIPDDTYDNPHKLEFDHRVAVSSPQFEALATQPGLSNAIKNVEATCLITTFDASNGWRQDATTQDWIYDPTLANPNVKEIPSWGDFFQRNLEMVISTVQSVIPEEFTRNGNSTMNITDSTIIDRLKQLNFPSYGLGSPKTQFRSRFPVANEFISGGDYSSAYHLGNGYVGTAGHCVVKYLLRKRLQDLKVVFGWTGDVKNKKSLAYKVFTVERVVLCDAPGEYRDGSGIAGIASWARRWDLAILKLTPDKNISGLATVTLASDPPAFGTPVYNAGFPLGTPMKVSPKAHVLRHAIYNGSDDPFQHAVAGYRTFTTDLDQFSGNSGGPVMNGSTGEVVGHTVSTQSTVGESTSVDRTKWENEFLVNSSNYKNIVEAINPYLDRKWPGMDRQLYPQMFRRYKPEHDAFFLNTTFICAGDIGPHGKMEPSGQDLAVFNRHHWDSTDVTHRNVSGRVDRNGIFVKSLRKIVDKYPTSTLTFQIAGPTGRFTRPSPLSKLYLAIGPNEWKIPLSALVPVPDPTPAPSNKTIYSFTVVIADKTRDSIPSDERILSDTLDYPMGASSWRYLRLEQPTLNPPTMIGVKYNVHRSSFDFPVDRSWPQNRPDITANPNDVNLKWPEEDFQFATCVGTSGSTTQTDVRPSAAPESTTDIKTKTWNWQAPFDRVWTNPRQPVAFPTWEAGTSLLDPMMLDVDPNLAQL